MNLMNSSNYIDVCSATGVAAPGYLPADLPRESGNSNLCHVNSLTSYTGIDPSSGGVFDSLVLAKYAEFGSKQAFKKAVQKYPELQEVVHVSGTGLYKIFAAYPGSLEIASNKVHEFAHARRLAPLKPYCPYIGSGTISY